MTQPPPVGSVAHFALNADDASRALYESVFGGRQFVPWGPPGFWKITRTDGALPGPIGALQQRRDLVAGAPPSVEPTVAVDDVDAACAACTANGGLVLLAKTLSPGVGQLAFLQDPSGTPISVMSYLADDPVDAAQVVSPD